MADDERSVRQLTNRMARGEEDAISSFYEAFFEVMLREAQLASRRDEEFCLDVVQDSMLKVIRKVRPIETFGQLEAWTRRLVRHVAYDQLRSEIRRKQREFRSSQRFCSDVTGIDHGEMEGMQQQLCWLADQLGKLDATESRLLEARYRAGLTLREISCKYGLSLGAVDGRIRRSLARLRHRYRESRDDKDE